MQRYAIVLVPTKFWDILQSFVTNGISIVAKTFSNVTYVQKRLHKNLLFIQLFYNFAIPMDKGHKETIKVRVISISFVVLALAIFKPFGLHTWQWEAYLHYINIGLLGFGVCLITETLLRFVVKMPRSYDQGIEYIIRRNLWFQFINTFLVSLMICLYRHFVLSNRIENNQLSWNNFLETLVIIAFCSFAIGLYWRYKFRSRYLAAELEETRILNEQLRKMQNKEEQRIKAIEESKVSDTLDQVNQLPSSIVLTGSTSETVTLQVSNLLYVEAVGNYVKIYQWFNEQVHNDMIRATTKQIEDNLCSYPMIVRCHRAFLINLGQVEKVISKSGSMQLLVKHCQEYIPVSRSNIAQIKETIKIIGKE